MQFLSDCSPPVYTKSQMPAASSLHFLLGSFHHMCNSMLQSSHTHIPAPVFWNNTIMVYHNDNLFPEKILPVSFILSSLLSSENIITYILKSGEYKIKRRNRISSLLFIFTLSSIYSPFTFTAASGFSALITSTIFFSISTSFSS